MEETQKIPFEEYVDLIPRIIEKAEQGDLWAEKYLWDCWRSRVDACPPRDVPVNLAQWVDSLIIKCVSEDKKIHHGSLLFKWVFIERKITLETEEQLREKEFIFFANVEGLREKDVTLENAVSQTAE